MADRLTKEEQRWRAAIRARRYDEALAICRRVEPLLASLVAESHGARRADGRRKAASLGGSVGPLGAPSVLNGWIPAPDLAREVGLDTRTIKRQLTGHVFASPISDRVTLVHRESYFAWVAAGRPAPQPQAS
jgi:hypothetical protein